MQHAVDEMAGTTVCRLPASLASRQVACRWRVQGRASSLQRQIQDKEKVGGGASFYSEMPASSLQKACAGEVAGMCLSETGRQPQPQPPQNAQEAVASPWISMICLQCKQFFPPNRCFEMAACKIFYFSCLLL